MDHGWQLTFSQRRIHHYPFLAGFKIQPWPELGVAGSFLAASKSVTV